MPKKPEDYFGNTEGPEPTPVFPPTEAQLAAMNKRRAIRAPLKETTDARVRRLRAESDKLEGK